MEIVNDPYQKKIIRIYGLFGLSLLLSLVPNIPAACVSAALGLGVLVIAYVLRTGAEENSLLENHMTFIIRTIWIGSFFAMLAMFAASFYLLKTIDNTPLNPCIEKFLAMGAVLDMSNPESLMGIFSNCWAAYWSANMKAFIGGGVIAAGPVLFYFIVRYARGLSRAIRGYRVSNPRTWF